MRAGGGAERDLRHLVGLRSGRGRGAGSSSASPSPAAPGQQRHGVHDLDRAAAPRGRPWRSAAGSRDCRRRPRRRRSRGCGRSSGRAGGPPSRARAGCRRRRCRSRGRCRQLDQPQAGDAPQQRARRAADALAVRQVTGVVVGHGDRSRASGRSASASSSLTSRTRARQARGRGVRQPVAVLPHRRAAARRVRDDPVDVGGKRRRQRRGPLPEIVEPAGVQLERAAAALARAGRRRRSPPARAGARCRG